MQENNTVSSDLKPARSFHNLEARIAFKKLEERVFSEETLHRPLHEVEQIQETLMREVNRLMIQEHVRARGDGDTGTQIEVKTVEECPVAETFKRGKLGTRIQTTIFGDIEVTRRGYSKPRHHSVFPLEDELQLSPRQYTYELQHRGISEAVKGSYDEARTTVKKYTGVDVPKRSLEAIVSDGAEDFDAFYQQKKPPSPEETASIVVAQVDCKGIPMRKVTKKKQPKAVPLKTGKKHNKKRMATVAVAFTTQPRVRTAEEVTESLFTSEKKSEPAKNKYKPPEHKRVWASLKKGKDAVIQELRDDVDRRDPDLSKKRVGVTDGEPALQSRIQKYIPGLILVLDILHALAYLWPAAYAFHEAGSNEAVQWVKERVLAILRGEVRDVVSGMRQSATEKELTTEQQEPIEKAANYFTKNFDFMRYDEYLRAGFPIASGPVEGACKNLINDRMERSGMRWTEDSAEAMVKLRALHVNGDLDEYWRFHIEQDQRRINATRGSGLPAAA
jgi:hypothetical protein